MTKNLMADRILILIFTVSIPASIGSLYLLFNEATMSPDLIKFIFLIPSAFMVFSFGFLIARNSDKVDNFIAIINILNLPLFPSDRVIRLKLIRIFGYVVAGFVVFEMLLFSVLLLLKQFGWVL
jgi:hypothetical protein